VSGEVTTIGARVLELTEPYLFPHETIKMF
jgi:hypothetical protein